MDHLHGCRTDGKYGDVPGTADAALPQICPRFLSARLGTVVRHSHRCFVWSVIVLDLPNRTDTPAPRNKRVLGGASALETNPVLEVTVEGP